MSREYSFPHLAQTEDLTASPRSFGAPKVVCSAFEVALHTIHTATVCQYHCRFRIRDCQASTGFVA